MCNPVAGLDCQRRVRACVRVSVRVSECVSVRVSEWVGARACGGCSKTNIMAAPNTKAGTFEVVIGVVENDNANVAAVVWSGTKRGG